MLTQYNIIHFNIYIFLFTLLLIINGLPNSNDNNKIKKQHKIKIDFENVLSIIHIKAFIYRFVINASAIETTGGVKRKKENYNKEKTIKSASGTGRFVIISSNRLQYI